MGKTEKTIPKTKSKAEAMTPETFTKIKTSADNLKSKVGKAVIKSS